jgi:hypothetical protein
MLRNLFLTLGCIVISLIVSMLVVSDTFRFLGMYIGVAVGSIILGLFVRGRAWILGASLGFVHGCVTLVLLAMVMQSFVHSGSADQAGVSRLYGYTLANITAICLEGALFSHLSVSVRLRYLSGKQDRNISDKEANL